MKLAGKMTAKIACAFLVVAAIAAAQTVVSVRDGVYTAAQGDRGKALYAANCASCHGAMLDGSGAAPPLAGADFIGNWKGQTAGDLHEKIQSTMPADQPGKLSREQNSDILAFLLASNNFPAGEKELPSEAAALGKIRIEADKAK